MAGRLQLAVLKQGSMEESHWSDRTLTIDAGTATATVSRRGHPHDVYHHSLRVNDIRKYPHIDLSHTGVDPDSEAAQWVMCLLGVEVPVPELSPSASDPVASLPDETKSMGEVGLIDAAPANGSGPSHPRTRVWSHEAVGDVFVQWLIRCPSEEGYRAAVALLEAITHAPDKAAVEAVHDASNPVAKELAMVPPKGGVLVMPASRTPAA